MTFCLQTVLAFGLAKDIKPFLKENIKVNGRQRPDDNFFQLSHHIKTLIEANCINIIHTGGKGFCS